MFPSLFDPQIVKDPTTKNAILNFMKNKNSKLKQSFDNRLIKVDPGKLFPESFEENFTSRIEATLCNSFENITVTTLGELFPDVQLTYPTKLETIDLTYMAEIDPPVPAIFAQSVMIHDGIGGNYLPGCITSSM